jgi:NYN domain-containing protein
MKVSIFFDGQNFYHSLLRYDESLRVDYDRLALWITQSVGGPTATFAGAYYYVGVSADAPPQVENFLKGLELRPGYFVKRERRVQRTVRCPACGEDYAYTTEKRVDTRLVADLIHYAANGAYDAAVLVSGDDDMVPAVEAVNALGKPVWVATWSADELSADLRVRCFGQLRLSEGLAAFRVERPRAVDRDRVPGALRGEARSGARVGPGRPLRPAGGPFTVERAIAELQRAESRLPHVSRGYFVMRWKSQQLPPPGHEREALVQQMVDGGLAEEFEVTDAEGRTVTALRVRERDGNVRDDTVAVPGGGVIADEAGERAES